MHFEVTANLLNKSEMRKDKCQTHLIGCFCVPIMQGRSWQKKAKAKEAIVMGSACKKAERSDVVMQKCWQLVAMAENAKIRPSS